MEKLLEFRGIGKYFPGVKALDDVSFDLYPGEVHVIVGENGAGKSTLMKVLSGAYTADAGEILLEGKPITRNSPRISEELGIRMIYQELNLVPELSIASNVFLGHELKKGFFVDKRAQEAKADELLRDMGIQVDSRTLVKNLGVGTQQMVEIAKALSKNAKLLILDEPTASLNEEDSKALLELLLKFKKEGMTSILISHKLNEIAYVADKITILRDGATIETLDKASEDTSEDRIIRGMVGRELTDRFPKREHSAIGDVAMEVKDWTVYHPLYSDRKVVDHVSLHVKKGEVVGICGLMGAGRTELAMSIFGGSYGANISGQLFINGTEVRLHTVEDAIRHKIAYVTEDRKGNGLILSNPIRINTTLSNLKEVSNHGVIDKDKEYMVAVEYKDRLKTKCPGVEQNVGNLSGGNQQKVLLAKWMFAQPDVLILDEPTRGIDVGAKYEIYCIINNLVAEGKSVIMISSELPEVLGMSDRIYIMNEGKIAGEVSAAEATQEAIMACILKSDKGE